eukprot:CAMPEP_0115120136 /NCGR_PEP_ID=MMETSP0227-20121206/45505_1 /TAXON_ID=89957 /ORGANISM="Polarella glacialis, Strain CCMP 1383" /LENGTH=945 /DNA_ID=CAMNT_0002521735 /DNA_START=139 /DNA_END=2976 /DNA_ORIENTATION=-
MSWAVADTAFAADLWRAQRPVLQTTQLGAPNRRAGLQRAALVFAEDHASSSGGGSSSSSFSFGSSLAAGAVLVAAAALRRARPLHQRSRSARSASYGRGKYGKFFGKGNKSEPLGSDVPKNESSSGGSGAKNGENPGSKMGAGSADDDDEEGLGEENWEEDGDWGDFNPNGARGVYGKNAKAFDYDEDDEDAMGNPMEDDDGDISMEFGDDGDDAEDEAWKANKSNDRERRWQESGGGQGLDEEDEWNDEQDFDMAGFRGSKDSRSGSFDSGNINGVFDGLDGEEDLMGDEEEEEIPSAQELSLLYDDFEVISKKNNKRQTDERKETAIEKEQTAQKIQKRKEGRRLETLEQREYVVTAEGVAIRTMPDSRSPRTGEILRQGTTFQAVEAVDGVDRDLRLYLKLADGKGWVFDDEKVFPGFPSVRLISVGGMNVEVKGPEPMKRPLVAVVGRPNVGKSTLVNRICDVPDGIGSLIFDAEGTTRDRTYRSGTHTDDCGDTYMFDMIDTGGLIFHDDADTITFAKEIKLQIDVALREAVAAIMVVDSTTGLINEDYEIANYLKQVYIKNGLRVILAVAKSDRLETMDVNAAEFWALGLGEPIPLAAIHKRGVWEITDAVINRGCDGVFPMKIKGENLTLSARDTAVSVAIVGKPNAGKSSLLNALVGEARCIVSDIPGTTTDAIDAYLETDEGKVYRFVDTAGIRRTRRIEPGTEWLAATRAIKAVKRADVALLVLDASMIMTGSSAKGSAYWCPDNQMRWIARQIEDKGSACVIVLSKWDAVPEKDEKTMTNFIQAIRANLAGAGQWAEVVTCSSKTGQRLKKILEAVDKTLAAHRKRVPTHTLNEVVRDALSWRLPAAKAHDQKQGRVYYATQVACEPPQIALFCNNPKLFGSNYKTYLENKLRQDLAWFGTPIQLEWRKRSERRAVSDAEEWLGPRLQAQEAWR